MVKIDKMGILIMDKVIFGHTLEIINKSIFN